MAFKAALSASLIVIFTLFDVLSLLPEFPLLVIRAVVTAVAVPLTVVTEVAVTRLVAAAVIVFKSAAATEPVSLTLTEPTILAKFFSSDAAPERTMVGTISSVTFPFTTVTALPDAGVN